MDNRYNDDMVKEMIKAGIERNVIVYDAKADVGEFTPRLVALMKVVTRQLAKMELEDIGVLESIIMSPEAHACTETWHPVATSVHKDAKGNVVGFGNIKFIVHDDLGHLSKFQVYCEEIDGTMAPSDNEIVIGVTSTGKVILGSV